MPDITFITNEGENTLERRLTELLKNANALDILVGYFRASGFDRIARHFAPDSQIRVRALVGIGADAETVNRVKKGLDFQSTASVREKCAAAAEKEMENAPDSGEVERGARKCMEMLEGKRMEIRAYPDRNLHAKLHIITFAEGDRDRGRVITGSSNLTESGLVHNLEFNVELKNAEDHEFALKKFNELWEKSTDVSTAMLETLQNRTWLRDNITPRELYLKCLSEYFRADLAPDRPDDELPGGMMQLEYQRQAVRNAERIIASYGGVFLSDVVGLGKTYMAAMLAKRLGGKSIVVAPPAVLDRDNPGSWHAVFDKFDANLYSRSLGRLEDFPQHELEQRDNFFIDEAHRFRSGGGVRYERLAELCRNKRVVLVTATPYNNRPGDILSLMSLFQPKRESDIPGVPDLEDFFGKRSRKLQKAPAGQRVAIAREIAADIRHRVSRFVTVRRTRAEIAAHFPDDLRNAELNFPEVEKPVPLFYKLDKSESAAFDAAVAAAQNLTYARYQPLTYLKDPAVRRAEITAEQNIVGFVKTLLVKRLESSFTAFRGTVDRLVESHRRFIDACEKHGAVFFSKRDMAKIMECLEKGDHGELQNLLDAGRASSMPADQFTAKLGKDLKADLRELEKLQSVWREIKTDPKLEEFVHNMREHKILKSGKTVVFTESAETAVRVTNELRKKSGGKNTLLYHSGIGPAERRKVTRNFDAAAGLAMLSSGYDILVTTDALAEGVNLHAARAVVNYDIPWNPTRLMQRAGRINRVGGPHKRIHIFNFFPTEKGEDAIGLTSAAKTKLAAFVALLGNDFRHLTEDESVSAHGLFDTLNSAKAAEGEDTDKDDESELKYLREIEKVRDNDPELYERVRNLPRKARTARPAARAVDDGALLTYFKVDDKLDKFFISRPEDGPRELSFVRAADKLRAAASTPSVALPKNYFDLLGGNRAAFAREATEAEPAAPKSGSVRQLAPMLAAVLSDNGLGQDAREFLAKVRERLDAGAIPSGIVSKALKALKDADQWNREKPDTAANLLRKIISDKILRLYHAEKSDKSSEKRRDVILSEFFAPAKTRKR